MPVLSNPNLTQSQAPPRQFRFGLSGVNCDLPSQGHSFVPE
jgi:hypothetical protein